MKSLILLSLTLVCQLASARIVAYKLNPVFEDETSRVLDVETLLIADGGRFEIRGILTNLKTELEQSSATNKKPFCEFSRNGFSLLETVVNRADFISTIKCSSYRHPTCPECQQPMQATCRMKSIVKCAKGPNSAGISNEILLEKMKGLLNVHIADSEESY